MLLRITNDPRPYAWGSRSAIAEFRGEAPSGDPEAEVWLGTHPGCPTAVVGADAAGLPPTLEEVVAAEGAGDRLPYLLKILAAASPLSLQAHPTPEQAARGFERENAAGIPLDAPHRNYKDDNAKPEIIVAVSEHFDALCGFRDPALSAADIRELAGDDPALVSLAERVEAEPLAAVFEWLITRGEGVDALVERAAVAAESASGPAADTMRMLAAEYPGDPGVVIALLLNRVSLSRGEALFLPAGNIHAYLSGLGIELMTASDNVLRGGLTPKHVDVPELLSVLDFTPLPPPFLSALPITDGVTAFRPQGAGFELVRVRDGAEFTAGPRSIVLSSEGSGTVTAADASPLALSRGEAVYVPAGERASVRADAGGELLVAAAAS
ncbi:mannose-6-phosphate isomerase, class I [Salinibacterium sp. SYSU T00001]|uniref:mannose-6-phosphate isomerase, class I n=1 Tax=Homoserinimonas sedimenticola TaxID=2986805 RepID=UPI00223565CF|nr:mannose-6-phosphate isomerase, class I [Salinibacterium sedimenticola]MCW4385009.1 mannose-6-phosphate isomerase, class I [Salinibacterium sedimenticola]